MYEKFLERNTDCISQMVDDTFIAQYADIAPASLITLWKEAGLGMFCDGLFRIINPENFRTLQMNTTRIHSVRPFCHLW